MSHGEMCIAAPCFSANIRGVPQGCPWRSVKPLCTVVVWLHQSVHVQAGGMPPPQSPPVSDQHLILLGGPDCGQQICPCLHPAGKATKPVCVQTASASIKAWKKKLFSSQTFQGKRIWCFRNWTSVWHIPRQTYPRLTVVIMPVSKCIGTTSAFH